MKNRLLESLLRSKSGQERLWKVWWLCGIPVAWLASALVIAAESARVDGHLTAADWMDVVRLLVYVLWAQLAWRCAHNVEIRICAPFARVALTAGFVVMYLA